MSKAIRKRKMNLWKKDPHCYWCGRVTIIHEHKLHKKTPNNAATVDHIVTRLDPLRGKIRGRTVLSCNKCNFIRGQREEAALGMQELRRRSSLGEKGEKNARK